MDYNKENREARIAAEAAQEESRLAVSKALAAARQCKTDSSAKETASRLGREAWEARKAAKEAAAAAASARRVACFKALPVVTAPEIPRAALPMKPPISIRIDEE